MAAATVQPFASGPGGRWLVEVAMHIPAALVIEVAPQGAALQTDDPVVPNEAAVLLPPLALQALGAFGRLSANPATGRFAQYIPPATAMFNNMLAQLPT